MRYLLFDLDGTLLNTRDGIVESVQKAIASKGIIIEDLCLLERHIGPPLKTGFMEHYGFDEETANEVVMEYRKHYREKGIPGTTVYDGMQECLTQLKNAGYHLMVATSKPEVLANQFLAHFELSQYFDFIGGSVEEGEHIRTKKAQVIQYVLETNHITAEDEVYMIGDRFHDVEGAKECGIPCVGVLHGFGSKEELLGAGATAVVCDCKELTTYFMERLG